MSTQKAATPQPLLQAIDLKKHYPVKRGYSPRNGW